MAQEYDCSIDARAERKLAESEVRVALENQKPYELEVTRAEEREMQHASPQIRALPLLAMLLALAALVCPMPTVAAEAALTVSLAPGKFNAVRLRNLPKDAVVAVAVQASGKISVSLLSQRDYRAFPNPKAPVFVGSVERTLSFTITIPETGTYYLVLDNRHSADARQVKFAIRAERGKGTPRLEPAPEPDTQPTPAEKLKGARAAVSLRSRRSRGFHDENPDCRFA